MAILRVCVEQLYGSIPEQLEAGSKNLSEAKNNIQSAVRNSPSDLDTNNLSSVADSCDYLIKLNNIIKEWVERKAKAFEDVDNVELKAEIKSKPIYERMAETIAQREKIREKKLDPIMEKLFLEDQTGLRKYADKYGDFLEVPIYCQSDYEDSYGGSTIHNAGCGITNIAEYLTKHGIMVDPAVIAYKYKGDPNGGTSSQMMMDILQDYGVTAERFYWGDAWGDAYGNGGKVIEALKNGKEVIVKVSSGTFTKGGHYITVTGITEDGKLIVYDPNKSNWDKLDGFTEGFDIRTITSCADDCFILDPIQSTPQNQSNSTTTTKKTIIKPIQVDLNDTDTNSEILEEPIGETNNNDNNTRVHDKWDYGYLTAAKGVIDYESADGKHMSETWCPLDVGQLVKNIQQYENIYYEQWTREDGVQMYGPYVIVAADVKQREQWGGGREDATYSYGDIVETSLGTGIVMDYCGRSNDTRKETNGEQTHYDIYTKWWDGGHYETVGYSEEYTPRDQAPSEVDTVTYTQDSLNEN